MGPPLHIATPLLVITCESQGMHKVSTYAFPFTKATNIQKIAFSFLETRQKKYCDRS